MKRMIQTKRLRKWLFSAFLFAASTASFAQDSPALSMTTNLPKGSDFVLGIHCRSEFDIDPGDGRPMHYDPGNYGTEGITFKVLGEEIKIYTVKEGLVSLYLGNADKGNGITKLDVSKLMWLKFLYCQGNFLEEIDLSRNHSLIELNISDNKLTNLSLGQCPLLNMLVCHDNRLRELDLKETARIEALRCSGNRITKITVNHLQGLKVLRCSENPINEVDVSNNLLLQQLDLARTAAGKVDVSALPDLRVLNISGTQIDKLILGKKPELRQFTAVGSGLSEITLDDMPRLERLDIRNNRIETICPASLPALTDFRCSNNPLKELDVTQNKLLKYLFAENCNLSSLNLSGNSNLFELLLSGNNINEIDLSPAPRLYLLWLSNNRLKYLDTRAATKLFSLFIDGNELSDNNLNEIITCLQDVGAINVGTATAWWKRWLLIKGNPGADRANIDEAKRKGWFVDVSDTWPGNPDAVRRPGDAGSPGRLFTYQDGKLTPVEGVAGSFLLLYDPAGNLLCREPYRITGDGIDLTRLPQGLYLALIRYPNGTVASCKYALSRK